MVPLGHSGIRVTDHRNCRPGPADYLRHSFASITVSGGDSLYLLSELLGHRNIKTSHYAYLANAPVRALADHTSITFRHIQLILHPRSLPGRHHRDRSLVLSLAPAPIGGFRSAIAAAITASGSSTSATLAHNSSNHSSSRLASAS
jgi:hypothetical protein